MDCDLTDSDMSGDEEIFPSIAPPETQKNKQKIEMKQGDQLFTQN